MSRPQTTKRGRPARKNKSGQDARAPSSQLPQIMERGRLARKSNHDHAEKPRERGLKLTTGWKPRPGVKRRAEDRLRRRRPVNGPALWSIPRRGHGEKPSQRAFAKGSDRMPPQREGPSTGLGLGRFSTTRPAAETKKSHTCTTRAKSQSFSETLTDLEPIPKVPSPSRDGTGQGQTRIRIGLKDSLRLQPPSPPTPLPQAGEGRL